MILLIREYITCRLIHLALKTAPIEMELILAKAFMSCLKIYIKQTRPTTPTETGK